jgi:hypothetical protein
MNEKREIEEQPRFVNLEKVAYVNNTCPFSKGNGGSEHCGLRFLMKRNKRSGDYRLRCPEQMPDSKRRSVKAPPECPLRERSVTIWPLETKNSEAIDAPSK